MDPTTNASVTKATPLMGQPVPTWMNVLRNLVGTENAPTLMGLMSKL